MKRLLYGFLTAFLMILPLAGIFAQQKYALVIGNGNYTSPDWKKLPNPANDASDMKDVLESLGFQVDSIINGSLDQMDRAVINFCRKLNNAGNAYGFFFYAGHGVQHQGENYLIPVDANIPSRNLLSQRALPVGFVLKELEDAKNELNIIVIDACREFLPDSWDKERGGSTRGLALVTAPKGSIVSFATAANSVAADGEGRNGLYTSFLLKNIATPGIDVNEVFRRTGSDVSRATGGKQFPETRNMYHEIAYLGSRPTPNAPVQPAQTAQAQTIAPPQTTSTAVGNITVTSDIAGVVMIDGEATGTRIKAGGTVTVDNVSTGSTEVAVKGDDGKIVKAPQMVMVAQGQTVTATVKATVPNTSAQPKVVTIKVTGDINNMIVSAYTGFLTSRGLRITGGEAYSYLLDVSFALEDVDIQNANNYKYAMYRINCSLKNKAGDVILSSSDYGREGHLTREQARQRAIRAAEQAIYNKDGFAAKFDALLPSLF